MRLGHLPSFIGALIGAAVISLSGAAHATPGPGQGSGLLGLLGQSTPPVQQIRRRRGISNPALLGLGILGAVATIYAIDQATRRRYRDLNAYCDERYGGFYDPRRDSCVVD
jgi:hypothetical protein